MSETAATPAEVVDRDFVLRGPAAEFFLDDAFEVLLEGGTRCGKSMAFLIKAKDVADRYPRSQQLIVRQTRTSLNESILKDVREKILWTGHEAISPTASVEHQSAYRWKNGSALVFAGLENVRDTSSSILSSEWDRIYVCQAEETSLSDWELLATRLSAVNTPYNQLTADCNPAAPSHWLNQRFSPEKLNKNRSRYPFRHWDNPAFYDGMYPNGSWTERGAKYMSILESTLTGIRRDRFLLNRWVAAEGVILENWDPRVHVIDAELIGDKSAGFFVSAPSLGPNPIRVSYFTCGVDWGWKPDPGCMQLWAYDSPRWHPLVRRFRVAEVMKLEWQREQWADLAEEWWERYDVKYFSCDSSDPENISYFNLRLGKKNYRNAPKLAIKCPPIGGGHQRAKHHTAGIDLMREGLGPLITNKETGQTSRGHVRSYFFRDAFPEGVDEELRRVGRPTSYEAEVESWVYQIDASGAPTSKPEEKCDQHAISCFVAGTQILTVNGTMPIEYVMPGDVALAPHEDEVLAVWASDEEVDLWELNTGVGRLVGTGSHRLWTQSGWKRLDEVSGDVLLVAKSPSTTGSGGIATRSLPGMRPGTTSAASSSERWSTSITTSGSVSVGHERRATTSIMRTATTATMPQATSSSCLRANTEFTIRRRPKLRKLRRNGYTILLMLGLDPRMLAQHARPANRDLELARYVERCGSAPTEAHASGLVVPSAIRFASSGVVLTTTVSGSARAAGRGRVYNLTTRTASRYLAGGVMASNCARYDETLSFVRGFGREQGYQERPPPDTVAAILYEEDQNMKKQRRLTGKRRAVWD